jgi:hypothetical protein
MLRLRRAPTSATNPRPCDLSSKPSTYPFKETNAITGVVVPSLRPAMVTQKGYPVANGRVSGRPSTARCERCGVCAGGCEATGAGWNGQLGDLSAKARRMTTR